MKRLRIVAAVVVALLGALFAALYTPDLSLDELKAHWAGPPSKFIDVDGLSVHCRDEGTGPTVLLLHGTGASLHTWQAWSDALRGNHRVVRLDLPGFGLTGPALDGDYRIAKMVAFVDAFTRKLGLDRFAVAGNSWGGEIAWTYTLDHPDRVSALILVDAAGMPMGRPTQLVFRMAQLPILSSLMAKLGTRSLVDKTLHDVYGDPARVTDELRRRYLELARRPGNRTSFAARMQATHVDRTSELSHIHVPTLILWGARDRLIPPANAEKFHAAIPGSTLIEYEGAGHVPMEELGQETAGQAALFLR